MQIWIGVTKGGVDLQEKWREKLWGQQTIDMPQKPHKIKATYNPTNITWILTEELQ